MAGPTFVRFVSAAPGRLVSRWDAPQSFIGARRASEEEVKATGERIVLNPGLVLPLTEEFCARFDRELRHAIRDGDLLERSAEHYQAWLELEAQREAEAHPPATEAPPAAEPGPGPEPVLEQPAEEAALASETTQASAPRSRK